MRALPHPYRSIVGLIIGAAVLHFIKGYQVLPLIMILICLLSFLFRKLAVWLHALMEGMLQFLGKLISTILLLGLYYLLLTPLAILAKSLTKKDPLKKVKPERSNFIRVEKTFSKERFEKLW